MGSLLENVSSCTRSVHSINNSILRFRWKAFVWSVPCLLAFSVTSPPLLFEFSCGPLPSAATLGLFKDGVDLLLITVLAIIWNEKTYFSSRTFYLKDSNKNLGPCLPSVISRSLQKFHFRINWKKKKSTSAETQIIRKIIVWVRLIWS